MGQGLDRQGVQPYSPDPSLSPTDKGVASGDPPNPNPTHNLTLPITRTVTLTLKVSPAKAAGRERRSAAIRDALHNFEFWRGVSDVAPGEIKERGVSELGFVSCCLVKPHAQSDALEAYASLQATACATGSTGKH